MMMKRMGGFCLLAALALPVAVGAQQQPGTESFITRRGADTVAVERFTRTPARLESELAIKGAPVQRFTAELAPNALVPRLEYSAQPAGASAPLVRATFVFRGDSVLASVSAPGAPPEQRFAPGAGAMPYVNLSTALLEQLLRRAAARGGDSVGIPLISIESGQAINAMVRRFGTDSATVKLATVELRFRTDASGRVLGGSVPTQGIVIERAAGAVRTAAAPPPDYSAPAGAPYRAEDVRVPTPAGFALAGTLTLPTGAKGRLPAVVTITGSGPQDRDAAISIVRGYRPFRQIADTLSRRGIAVLRLDDRGTGASGGNFASATSADFADDVRAAVAYLRTRPDIDPARIALIGHSEGGMIAPMVAATDAKIRAIALLAGQGWTGTETSDSQLRTVWQQMGLNAAQMDSMARINTPLRDAQAAEVPWMRFWLDYDPLPAARRVRQPVLVLQGGTDWQVVPEQATVLAAAFRQGGNRDVTLKLFPELDHLFLVDPAPVASVEHYTTLPNRQVPPEVLGTLADWLVPRLR
jgi:alpha-beta hydrolase superfamily lysophospholipase